MISKLSAKITFFNYDLASKPPEGISAPKPPEGGFKSVG